MKHAPGMTDVVMRLLSLFACLFTYLFVCDICLSYLPIYHLPSIIYHVFAIIYLSIYHTYLSSSYLLSIYQSIYLSIIYHLLSIIYHTYYLSTHTSSSLPSFYSFN